MLDFRILGPLEVVSDRGSLRLGGPRQRATLAILLLNANRVVPVERLADDLYAGAPPVTAVAQVQRQVSELRAALGSASTIETRAPGYLIRVGAAEVDLNRFEDRAAEGARALAVGDAARAADLLRQALALWRGPPLADFRYDSFAQQSIARLEEMQLSTLEERIDADLALARHAELVAELESLVAEHPLRERLRGQLMLALYRSGRQPEALDIYRRTRAGLVQEFGIEPSPMLQSLERAILDQDPSLDVERARRSAAERTDRSVLVVPRTDDGLDRLVEIAAALGRPERRELIIARLLADEAELADAASDLSARRAALATAARTAAFTTKDRAADTARLAAIHDVELVLVEAASDLAGDRIPDELVGIFETCPCDVAALIGALEDRIGGGIFVPFGGGEHDWAALELAAWLALGLDAPLRLVGTRADPPRGRRDASRLLADASLALQRVVGVESEPSLVDPTEAALVAAVATATLVVIGISPRWRSEGIGATRRALARDARRPVLIVHHGPRPGGLAPPESRTRFTWSVAAR